ncbi:hypothetical protein AB3R30_21195 [Leptolyngbyaceae cyanobacterium UHCC 1019]
MTQNHENGSRLDRIESIILELATASVRHDNEFSRINKTLERINEQQAANARQIEANTRQIEANTRQGELNQESIHTLTASIQDLRNLVADYIQGRS